MMKNEFENLIHGSLTDEDRDRIHVASGNSEYIWEGRSSRAV